MKNITIYFYILSFICVLIYNTHAQQINDSPQYNKSVSKLIFAKNNNDENIKGKSITSWQRGIIPIIFYSDETKLAGGMGLQFVKKEDSGKYFSNFRIIGFYTQKKQYVIEIKPEIYFNKENYKFIGNLTYLYYPDVLFGTGNNTNKADKEDLTARLFKFKPQIQRKIFNNFYFGIVYDLLNADIVKIKNGGLLNNDLITGSNGGTTSGIGANLTWDSRDDNLYPFSGFYHQLTVTSYGSTLGSDYVYNSYLLDLRHYKTIFKNKILAFQGVVGVNSEEAQFQLLHQLGSYLRGYTQTRFMDKNLIAVRAEFRMPITNLFGLVFFTGIGEVFHKFEMMSVDGIKPAAGLGIRYLLLPEQIVYVRIDYGIGKDDTSFDINLMEAF